MACVILEKHASSSNFPGSKLRKSSTTEGGELIDFRLYLVAMAHNYFHIQYSNIDITCCLCFRERTGKACFCFIVVKGDCRDSGMYRVKFPKKKDACQTGSTDARCPF